MNCEEVKKYISDLVDHELDHETEKSILKHIENCSKCKSIYEEEKLIKETILAETLEELPNGFELRLHEKLENENNNMNKDNNKKESKVIKLFKKNKKYLSIAAIFVLSIVLINNLPLGMNGSVSSDMAREESVESKEISINESFGNAEPTLRSFDAEMADQAITDEETTEEAPAESEMVASDIDDGSLNEYQTGRVIIKNGNISLDILNLDETIQSISNKVTLYDGYISNQQSSISYVDSSGKEYRNGHIQVKISSEHFEEFMNFAKALGRLRNSNANSNDITNQYRDTVSRIENLEITQERLRDLLKKSETVEETLQIERELTRIRGELEHLKGTVKNWDRLSQFSTINISLNEVEAIEVKIQSIDKNIFQKSKEGLMNTINMIRSFLERSFISLVAYSPIIILLVIGLLIIRKIFKRSEKK
jgi:hypothetical protein